MDPITREEMYLAAAAGYAVEPPEPITRKEVFLAKLAGMDVETPAPFTRRERFIEEAAMAESNAVIEPLQVTENGTYTAPAGVDGYNPVTVAVPAPEVKLQDKTITENGEYTADSGFDGLGKVTVNVAGSGENGDDEGVPFLQLLSKQATNTNKTNVNTTQTIDIPKDAKIIRAWAGAIYNVNQTYYTYIQNVSPISADALSITQYDDFDRVSYTHKSAWASQAYSSYNTFEFRVLIATDIITVKPAGDGLYDGTVSLKSSYNKFANTTMGLNPIMYLKSLKFAPEVSEVPESVCAQQALLENVDLSNVTSIGRSAFSNCTSLKNVDLSNATSIGGGAFLRCTSIKEIVLSDKLTILEDEVFRETKIDRVVFPAGFVGTSSYGRPFYKCTHPTEFDFSACTSVPTLYYANSLGEVGNGQVLKIPSALFDEWSTADKWSDWAAQMVAV